SKNIDLYNDFFKYCNIFEITRKTAEYYADIRFELKKMGKPIPENDIWIAAFSKANNILLFSFDSHFDFIPDFKYLKSL
ncbi:MAG: PIN domain-containing protein, partial [Bacteroidetes bacterium]|nr:PIN domain-containing protein [Bacteroidota bacterium]